MDGHDSLDLSQLASIVSLRSHEARREFDQRVRLAAFQWLRAQMDVRGEVLPRSLLEEGFMFDGRRVPLLGPQGIFKPALCDLPLSITTLPNSPHATIACGAHEMTRGADVQCPLAKAGRLRRQELLDAADPQAPGRCHRI